ncbi:hypothetical protein BJY04DRAFT_223637 [Aspergillus karnatakaensis]|uniref:uncharacterized protein n=1 Tax=Aspergillus karnatakaensis TaxID=1810916 RepID=UPI003CCCE4CA
MSILEYIEIYVGIGVHEIKSNPKHPRHWSLLVAPSKSETCTYYSVQGSMDYSKPITYIPVQFPDFNVNDPRLETKEPVMIISAGLYNVLEQTIASVRPQRCQDYVLAILETLAKNEQVKCGKVVDRCKTLVDKSLYEKTKQYPFCGDTLFDLSVTAVFERISGLKFDKCCY